jgi:N-acetylmuramoyl-L-alanine amidase
MRNVIPGLGWQNSQSFFDKKALLLGRLMPSVCGIFLLSTPVGATQLASEQLVLDTPSEIPATSLDITTLSDTPAPNSDIHTPELLAAKPARTLLQDVEIMPEGFIIQTSGRTPAIQVKQASDGRWMSIDIQDASLTNQFGSRNIPVNQSGVSNIYITQVPASPPVVRITLNKEPNSVWQAQVSELGRLVVWPQGGTAPSLTATNQVATIESVQLNDAGTQVVIKADQPVTFNSGWDKSTAAYRITIPAAKLTNQLQTPQPQQGSPILWMRVEEDASQAVVVLVQPTAGVQIQGVTQPDRQQVSLNLKPSAVVVQLPPDNPPTPITPAPVPPPNPTPPPPPSPNVPKGRVVIAIDPGHGGRDAGAVGIGGLREKDVVLDISRQVAQILEQQGVQAVMTRSDDREIGLAPRVQLANRINATLFVSIHANAISMSRPDVSGLETYYYRDGLGLARTIHNNILQNTNMKNRGVKQARFYVIKYSAMPAVLVEVGFVTGREDAAKLSDSQFRTQMAQAIAQGILQYVKQMR